MSGLQSYVKGHAAEGLVERYYVEHGACIAARRRRMASAEIDLIAQDGDEFVFIEVKTSRTHDRAMQAVRPAQMNRIALAAQEFMDVEGHNSLCPMRFDIALVDGTGRIDVVKGIHFH
ncbi:MAG: YraN family protein [Pseudomonadota bacterium]